MAFPTTPATGKGAKVYVNSNDGSYEASTSMTKQATYTYKGETYTNRVYLLGDGKTLINQRPAVEPRIDIDGIVDGLLTNITTSADTVETTAGTILVDNTEVTCAADSAITVVRPASTCFAWAAIIVSTGGTVSYTKGTDSTAGGTVADLLDTYGADAGERPLIPVDSLLVGLWKMDDTTAVFESSDRSYDDRETSDIDKQVLPNIGGCLIPTALPLMHTGTVSRTVKFTGYYLDDSMAEVGTAKSWSLSPSTNEVSDSTFFRTVSITEISGWSFSFDQLATDPKIMNNILDRQGFGAVKLQYPNGGYWQSAATFGATFNCATGALVDISVSGSLMDDPVFT